MFFKSFYPHKEDRPQMRLKAEYVLKLVNLLPLDFFVPGEIDFAEGASHLFDKLLSQATFTVLGANLTLPHTVSDKAKNLHIPYSIKEYGGVTVLIAGFCNDTYNISVKGEKVSVSDPVNIMKSILAEVSSSKKHIDLIVVLSHLGRVNDEELATIIPEIDVIVGGHDCENDEEPVIVGDTIIVEAYKMGVYLGKLDLTLSETGQISDYNNNYVAVGKDIKEDIRALELLKQYRADVVKLNSQTSSENASGEKKKKVFWFHNLCSHCHKEQHEFWENTKHSQAYHTLEKKNAHLDYECVGCHTIGFREDGGFTHFDKVSNHKNVQCEACHGPGSEHSSDTYKSNAQNKATCISCHDNDHDPNFDLEKSLSKIKCPPMKQ